MRGIAWAMVIDGEGVIRYHEPGLVDEEGGLDAISAVVSECENKTKSSPELAGGHTRHGVRYHPSLKKKIPALIESDPCLAADSKGKVYLAFCRGKELGAVFLQAWAGGKMEGEIMCSRMTKLEHDNLSPSLCVDGKGIVHLAWTTCGVEKYQVCVARPAGNEGEYGMEQVTECDDDAMAPRLAVDSSGKVRLTYYAWNEWKKGLSRDREVFLCGYDSGTWSKAVQFSPTSVPEYEDHTDPAICGDGQGGMWVAWSWDYHGTLPEGNIAAEPSIFARRVGADGKPGGLVCVGTKAPEGKRARDFAPAIATAQDGSVWCAWDNLHYGSLGFGSKAIFVAKIDTDGSGDHIELAASKEQIGPAVLVGSLTLWERDRVRAVKTPRDLIAFWVSREKKNPGIRYRALKAGKWCEEKTMLIGDFRGLAACCDSNGVLWLAVSRVTPEGWKVELVEGKID
ncbi:MAG: hypothetical protein RDV41_05010 [Planctomycetota bacterium]|nr:hypothetical protein [Planctomycetota bacterium]